MATMLKQKIPHIILRFGKQPVAPPPPAQPASTNTTTNTTTTAVAAAATTAAAAIAAAPSRGGAREQTPDSEGYRTARENSLSSSAGDSSCFESDDDADDDADDDETESDPEMMPYAAKKAERRAPLRKNKRQPQQPVPLPQPPSPPQKKPPPPKRNTIKLPAQPALSQSIGKRKRDIPKAIGGGKGDLQPPPKGGATRAPRRPAQKRTADNAAQTQGAGEQKKPAEEKRVLRSQDVTRKSEWDEWFESCKDEENDRKMPIVDELPPNWPPPHLARPGVINKPGESSQTNASTTTDVPAASAIPTANLAPPPFTFNPPPVDDPTYLDYMRNLPVETIDLEEEARKEALAKKGSSSSTRPATRSAEDPLPDSLFLAEHRRQELREKRYRNIERAQHAHGIDQLNGDIERLRAPEWIKTIGLSQSIVNKLDKKTLELRRDRLIQHLENLVRKHKQYKAEETRLNNGGKRRSPKNSHERDNTSEREGDRDRGSRRDKASQNHHSNRDDVVDEFEFVVSNTDEEGDGENEHRTKRRRRGPYKRTTATAARDNKAPVGRNPATTSTSSQSKPKAAEPEPFKSFYRTPYLRQQAMGGSRKSARILTAFGAPLPAMEERDFALPADIAEDPAAAAGARELRARKRLRRLE